MLALLCASIWVLEVMAAIGQGLPCENLPLPNTPKSSSDDSYGWLDPNDDFAPSDICFNSTCTVTEAPRVCAAILHHSRRANCSNSVPCCMRKDRCVKSFTWNGKPKNRCIAKSEAENSALCMNSAGCFASFVGVKVATMFKQCQHRSRRKLMRAMKSKCSVHLA